MSTLEETLTNTPSSSRVPARRVESIFSRFLSFICSVRLGVSLLVLLGLGCLIGMLVMQQNVAGFDRYFAQLAPAQRLLYAKLGIFDIYHSWYFNALLCMVSANIILASIDRFPKIWIFAKKPTVTVPLRWLRDQKTNADIQIMGSQEDVIARVSDAIKRAGWRKVITDEKNGRTFIMGQSGLWNRFGFLAVHVGLLTIFAGGFLTAQLGSTGQMPLTPGQTTDLTLDTVVNLDKASEVTKRLPFVITCTDIQQRLIKKDGSLSASNTIDWFTRFTIKDETGTHEASVQMNQPFDYRGYRFFQASFVNVGRARNISVKLISPNGGEPQVVSIPRDGSVTLSDGTVVAFSEFRGNFRIGQEDPNDESGDYPNPAAVLKVTAPGAAPETAYAFGPQMANMPVAGKPIAGYTYQLVDFEKVADQHILSVQRDPGTTVVYIGFVLLFLTLVAVFFFAHQRVWAAIAKTGDDTFDVVLAGNTNHNANAFDEKFRRFVNKLETNES